MRTSLKVGNVGFFLECLALLCVCTHGQLNIRGECAWNMEHVWQSEDNLGYYSSISISQIPFSFFSFFLSFYIFLFFLAGSLICLEVPHIIQDSCQGSFQKSTLLCFGNPPPHVTTVRFQVSNHCTRLFKLVLGVWTQVLTLTKQVFSQPLHSQAWTLSSWLAKILGDKSPEFWLWRWRSCDKLSEKEAGWHTNLCGALQLLSFIVVISSHSYSSQLLGRISFLWPWLAWNLQCRSGWPWTFCLSLPGARINGKCLLGC